MHGSNFGANFLKTASKIQNSNVIVWGGTRASASLNYDVIRKCFGLGYGVHYLGIRFNDARAQAEAHEVARGQELAVRRLARQTASSHILPVIQNI